jgi:hypothetical protein
VPSGQNDAFTDYGTAAKEMVITSNCYAVSESVGRLTTDYAPLNRNRLSDNGRFIDRAVEGLNEIPLEDLAR